MNKYSELFDEYQTTNTELQQFSFFTKPITNTIPEKSISLEELSQLIKEPNYKQITEELRSFPDKKTASAYKASVFDYVTISGTFNSRSDSNLMSHSGLICLDFDNLTDLPDLHSKLLADPHTVMLFISPSGNGLKWVIKINPNKGQQEQFKAVEGYVLSKYGEKVDTSCKDVSRPCFIPYDPKVFFAPNYHVLPLFDMALYTAPGKPSSEIKEPGHGNEFKPIDSPTNERICFCIAQIQQKGIDLTSSYQNWLMNGFAFASFGEAGRIYFHMLSKIHPDYDHSECDRQFDVCLNKYDGRTDIATFFHYCSNAGIHFKKENKAATNLATQLKSLPPVRSSMQRLEDAKNLPPIKKLCSVIFQTGELMLLFADTGVGKSILAIALSDAISKGESFIGLQNDNAALPVLYYDFEMSDMQFRMRYTNSFGEVYPFASNFHIDTIDFVALYEASPQTPFEDLLFARIEKDLIQTQAKLLVVDNLTYLNSQSTEDTKVALTVMRRLNEIKKRYNISIIVVAHTPKRISTNPININDLAGSKQLSNFADSVSAIGKSVQGKDIRYWKQIKPSRSAEMLYDTNNVITCEIGKQDSILTFKFIGFNNEKDHLIGDDNSDWKKNKALELSKQGKSQREIALELDLGKSTVNRWVNDVPPI